MRYQQTDLQNVLFPFGLYTYNSLNFKTSTCCNNWDHFKSTTGSALAVICKLLQSWFGAGKKAV